MFENIKNKVVATAQLASLRKQHADQTIVFCSECYDILPSIGEDLFNLENSVKKMVALYCLTAKSKN